MNKFIKRFNKKYVMLALVVYLILLTPFGIQTELFAKDNEYLKLHDNKQQMQQELVELKSESLEERVSRTQDFSVHFLEDTYFGINKDDYFATGQAYFITENTNNYPVFCIIPEVEFTTLSSVENIAETNEDTFSNLDESVQKNIISIMNYSIDQYAETGSNVFLAAGQLLIWNELGYKLTDLSENIKGEVLDIKNNVSFVDEAYEDNNLLNPFLNTIIINVDATTMDNEVYGTDDVSDFSLQDSSTTLDPSTTDPDPIDTNSPVLYDTSGQDLIGQDNSSTDGGDNLVPTTYNEKPTIIVDDELAVIPGTDVTKELLISDANLSVTDKEDGNLIDSENTIIDFGNLDNTTPGSYNVTIKTKDSAGQEAQDSIMIIVTNPPKITIDDTIFVGINTNIDKDFLIANANLKVTDVEDGDLTNDEKTIVDLNDYDKSNPGSYEIDIEATDSDGLTAETTFTIIVDDNIPTITIDSRVVVKVNTEITKQYLIDNANLKAYDVEDGDITDDLILDLNDLDTTVVGEYIIGLSVVDSDGNIANNSTIVEVVSDGPILTVDESTTVFVGELPAVTHEFLVDELHMQATDEVDGDITSLVEILPNDYEDKVGSYAINLSVSNSAGVSTQATTTINVIENTAPVIVLDDEIIVDLEQDIDIPFLVNNANLVIYDNEDGDLTESDKTVLDISMYDSSNFGEYPVSVSTEDSQGLIATDSIIVKIINEVPILELEENITVPYNTSVDEQYLINNGYVLKALDKEDGDISETLVLDCPLLDTSSAGDYTCEGTITDSAGATATDITTITVLPFNNPPIIRIDNTTVEIGTVVDQEYYISNGLVEAVDPEDGDLTNTDSLVIDFESYDKNNVGEYLITAYATDSQGLVTTKTAIIKVIDSSITETPKIFVDPLTVTDISNKGSIDKQFLIDNSNLSFVGTDGEEYLKNKAVVSSEKNCILGSCTYGGDEYVTINVDSSSGYSADEVRAEIIFDSPPTLHVQDIEMIETPTPFELTPLNLINYMPDGTVVFSDDIDTESELIVNSTIKPKTKSLEVGDVPGKYTYIYSVTDTYGHVVEDEFTITVLDIPEIYGNSNITINYFEQADFNGYYNKLTSEAAYLSNPSLYPLGLYVDDSDENDLYWEDVSNVEVTTGLYDPKVTTNDPGVYTLYYKVIDSGTASTNGTRLYSSDFKLELTILPSAEKTIDIINKSNTMNTSKYDIEYNVPGYTYVDSELKLSDNVGNEILTDKGGGIQVQTSDSVVPPGYTVINTCNSLVNEISANPSGSFILTSDLDCYGENMSILQLETTFTGKLDGNDHVINGLTTIVSEDASCTDDSECLVVGGLFAKSKNATITNLGINDLDMTINLSPGDTTAATDAVKVGGLIGESEGGVFENVYVQGNIVVTGGDSVNHYVVSSLSGFGGLIGVDFATSSSSVSPLTITNTYTNVDMYGTTVNTGGLIGKVSRIHTGNGALTIDNAMAHGDIVSSFVSEGITSTLGGLLGYVSVKDGVVVSDSLYSGTLTGLKSSPGNTDHDYVSHTIGFSEGTVLSIDNLYYGEGDLVIAGEIVEDTNKSNSIELSKIALQDEATYNFLNSNWYIPTNVSIDNQPLLKDLIVSYEYVDGLDASEYDQFSPSLEIYVNLNQQIDIPLASSMHLVSTLSINNGSGIETIDSVNNSNGKSSYEALSFDLRKYINEILK